MYIIVLKYKRHFHELQYFALSYRCNLHVKCEIFYNPCVNLFAATQPSRDRITGIKSGTNPEKDPFDIDSQSAIGRINARHVKSRLVYDACTDT